MGYITHHDIARLKDVYNTSHFIETGTGGGDGIASIQLYGFKTIDSIEITPLLYKKAVERFSSDKTVDIHLGDSRDILPIILEDIPQTEPILFWLDGHYPGADYGLGTYKAEDIPLESELRLIKQLRPSAKDVFIADDLRIYLTGAFSNGNSWIPPVGNINFIYELFQDTHEIKLSYDHEGYICLLPK